MYHTPAIHKQKVDMHAPCIKFAQTIQPTMPKLHTKFQTFPLVTAEFCFFLTRKMDKQTYGRQDVCKKKGKT